MRHWGNIIKIAQFYKPVTKEYKGIRGVWIWGESGVGKSRRARADYPDYYDKSTDKWFCDY